MLKIYPYFKGTSYPLKPYEKEGFTRTQRVPDESDIIESVIKLNNEPVDVHNVYSSIGKIFENADKLQTAQMFVEKNLKYLNDNNKSRELVDEAMLDFDRINKKIYNQQTLNIEG